MPSRILVLEDNTAHMEALCEILKGTHCDIEIHRADSYPAALQILGNYTIQVFILDIILDTKRPGDVSGLKLAQMLRESEKYKYTPIIFTTSVEDPKLYSYSKLHCFGYIEKPYDAQELRKTVLDALEIPVPLNDDRYVSFQKDRILYSKQLKEIICLEVSRKEVKVYCQQDELTVPYRSCKELLELFDSDSFIQCSRYTIVNKNYIDYIDYLSRYIKLKGMDKQMEIGRVMKKEFEEQMNKWYQKR